MGIYTDFPLFGLQTLDLVPFQFTLDLILVYFSLIQIQSCLFGCTISATWHCHVTYSIICHFTIILCSSPVASWGSKVAVEWSLQNLSGSKKSSRNFLISVWIIC